MKTTENAMSTRAFFMKAAAVPSFHPPTKRKRNGTKQRTHAGRQEKTPKAVFSVAGRGTIAERWVKTIDNTVFNSLQAAVQGWNDGGTMGGTAGAG
jgi:hypothetical protein